MRATARAIVRRAIAEATESAEHDSGQEATVQDPSWTVVPPGSDMSVCDLQAMTLNGNCVDINHNLPNKEIAQFGLPIEEPGMSEQCEAAEMSITTREVHHANGDSPNEASATETREVMPLSNPIEGDRD